MELGDEKKTDDNCFSRSTIHHVPYLNDSLLNNNKKEDNFPSKEVYSINPQNSILGFKNLGNTCYLNAALQCLSHTKELANYFLSNSTRSNFCFN